MRNSVQSKLTPLNVISQKVPHELRMQTHTGRTHHNMHQHLPLCDGELDELNTMMMMMMMTLNETF